MFRKLLPRSDDFFDYFESHAALIVASAEGLKAFTQPHINKDEAFFHIKRCEQKADKITHECIEALHKTFITPIERTDIHHLISTMDDVVDEIEDVGKFFVLYKFDALDEVGMEFVDILVSCAKEIQGAINEIKKLKNTDTLRGHFFNINHLENGADTLFMRGLKNLFDSQKETLTILKWKEIYEHLEQAIDACEDVANILEGIVIEYD
jgi:uncharacterized protein